MAALPACFDAEVKRFERIWSITGCMYTCLVEVRSTVYRLASGHVTYSFVELDVYWLLFGLTH